MANRPASVPWVRGLRKWRILIGKFNDQGFFVLHMRINVMIHIPMLNMFTGVKAGELTCTYPWARKHACTRKFYEGIDICFRVFYVCKTTTSSISKWSILCVCMCLCLSFSLCDCCSFRVAFDTTPSSPSSPSSPRPVAFDASPSSPSSPGVFMNANASTIAFRKWLVWIYKYIYISLFPLCARTCEREWIHNRM